MFKFLRCLGYFHKFEIVKDLSRNALRAKCSRCQNEYAVNMSMGAIMRWSPKVADLYRGFNAAKSTPHD
jgi:hypothetical protein